MKLRAGFLREFARARRFPVGYRKKLDAGMLRCEACAQPPDAAGANDCNA